MFLNLILWYLVIALAGWLVFPLAFRMLTFLPDRGLAVSRPLGLLLWGYAYWLLVSLGILQNDTGGALFALLLVGGLSLWGVWKGGWKWKEIAAWLRERRGLVLATELLFLALFVFMALVRAANPDASGTEKPMELAFINSILRSPTFPPADPWLSEYAISYYYFGYVMVAVLARISGTPGGVAFNLALATWFALSGLAAYGLLYNLLAARGKQIARGVGDLLGALFAPLFLLIVGNLEGFLELLHASNLFWKRGADGALTSKFWAWLDIQELTTPPSLPFDWEPQRAGGIWWWRASRVLQDYTLNDQSREIIDEFPAFSYVLGDLHPHVLAMPFVLLAVSLALNIYLKLRDGDGQRSTANRLHVVDWLRTEEFWLAALVLGGLSFLNTWDFPIYLLLFAAAVALAHLASTGWRWGLVARFLEAALPLLLAGVLLYLPFYLGFASQANGLLPSLVFFTRGIHFWVMFGALLLPVVIWLVWLAVKWQRARREPAFIEGLLVAGALIGGLWLFFFLIGWAVLFWIMFDALLLPAVIWLVWLAIKWQRAGRTPAFIKGLLVAGALIGGLWLLSMLFGALVLRRDPGLAGAIWGAEQAGSLLQAAFTRRLVAPGMWLTLLGLLVLVWGLIQANHCRAKKDIEPVDAGLVETQAETAGEAPTGEAPVSEALAGEEPQALLPSSRADVFVLLLILLGAGLALFPEFFYLRDQFGWRMNTIFKFYYQTWVVWAIVAGYASVVLLRETLKSWMGIVFPLLLTVLLGMALVYPYFGFGQTLQNFDLETATLDGTAYLERYSSDDMEAIRWLQNAPYGYVAEAIGGSYTGFARVSTMSGLPAVLGWPGHESQWRGGEEEKGTREADIIQLYKARRWDQANPILEKYHIRYVFVGSLERTMYRPNDSLFQQNLLAVFRNASVTIYEDPRYNTQGKQALQP